MTSFFKEIVEIRNRKDFLSYLVTGEVKTRYRNLGLGALWAILEPLFMMAIYVGLIVVIFKRGGPQYPLYLLSGLVIFRWSQQSMVSSVKTILGNARLVQTVAFPKTILPLSRTIISFVDFSMGLLILFPLMFVFDAQFSPWLALLPVLILLQFIFNFGIAAFLSIAGVHVRDLQNLMGFVMRILLYASPVLFSIDMVPERFKTIYLVLNPFASLIENYRNILIRGTAPDWTIFIFALYALIALVVGVMYCRKHGGTIVKVL